MLFTLISGILIGIFYGLMGLGLNFIFGVMKIVNLAHGDFVMLGAFGVYLAYSVWNLNPLIALGIELVIFLAIGIPLYYGFVPRLLKSRDPEMLSLILFFGLSQVIESLASFAFGTNPDTVNPTVFGSQPVNIFGQSIQMSWIVAVLISLLAMAFMYGYLYHTKIGIATRAIMGHRTEAMSSGINVHRVSAIAFAIGIALAITAGSMTPFVLGGIYPSMGVDLTTTSFAVIVIGSLGNPLGTILGGLIYGICLMLMQTYLPSWSSLVPYLLLILILLFRPSGLLGRRERNA
ncbi:branched-chain amino acid ABC transporter permease [Sulfoacidibacillus thermotolerans]|uniref:Branched-chain amino acid ABC transporter permease n=1 Tax=Sulfoacidibacillus thermotolerans TaxID=1765684 RepID=A0A2U3D954_SULT2|nr:branched-chain amino acid ABC transporter permease [Sulfoacidibacillus thermotolerans]PWI57807.1 branched-chain amino acid ABC transporter permease [Sulfoacidibacillus thermotolerans]